MAPLPRALVSLSPGFRPRATTISSRRSFYSSRQNSASKSPIPGSLSVMILGALLTYSLYPTDKPPQRLRPESRSRRVPYQAAPNARATEPEIESTDEGDEASQTTWSRFVGGFEGIAVATQNGGSKLSDKVVDMIMPEWGKNIPAYVKKLQRELNMEPGSLADEIWQEAHDASVHPEIQYSAKVRVSEHLCEEEKTFLSRRKKAVAAALARYLELREDDVHPDDVPTIAICGSGGGLRALVSGTGSFLAAAEDGLFDCTTYISGVSGSCWLQSLYYSSITEQSFNQALGHLKARLGIHIADPPTAFSALTFAPTNKYLLSGIVEKLKGGPQGADFGLVDAYGMLLAARLLVPKGELGVNERDFKLSNQRDYIRFGQHPLPIYTAVRHEIPDIGGAPPTGPGSVSEEAKEIAKKEAWFQWFEMTPYEFFCEEFGAGIPTWAMGRRFQNGLDHPSEDGLRLPEVRMTALMGIWGSAFCATLSHYYKEIRPIIKSLGAFQVIDDMIWGRNEDLSKVHPIDPASLPNFVYGMRGQLPQTTPETLYDTEYIHLMDAGMSNNLPIYPLLRPGRDVDIIVAFDASADVKTDNWLSEVEGYARQRGIKGWPVGVGWPKSTASASVTAHELEQAQADSGVDVEDKLSEAKAEQASRRADAGDDPAVDETRQESSLAGEKSESQKATEAAQELGYCTVWVGRTQERTSEPPPPPVDDTSTWRLMEPDAGIAVVYLPFLANDKVPGVDPATNDYMSTWNFVYTPQQIDNAVALARANYDEGRDRIRATVRAVYERKKNIRLERKARAKEERYRRRVRLGTVDKLGEGDHFS